MNQAKIRYNSAVREISDIQDSIQLKSSELASLQEAKEEFVMSIWIFYGCMSRVIIWMKKQKRNEEAMALGVNFSQVLQEALLQKIYNR